MGREAENHIKNPISDGRQVGDILWTRDWLLFKFRKVGLTGQSAIYSIVILWKEMVLSFSAILRDKTDLSCAINFDKPLVMYIQFKQSYNFFCVFALQPPPIFSVTRRSRSDGSE